MAVLILAGIAPSAVADEAQGQVLLEKAEQMRGPRVEFARQHAAQISLTPDQKSFYVLWLPPGTDLKNPPPLIVTVGGHSTYAFDDFFVWYPFLKEKGYGLLALQWWLGENQSLHGYLTPREIYESLESILSQTGVRPGTLLLHGFSRGSANIYSIAALDRAGGRKYFRLIVANAGKPNRDYPPTHEIEVGVFGEKPFEGTHWVTFGGGKDPNPDRDGIPGMREAGKWIESYGGKVELAIEDPEGEHGGFHRNPENVKAAFDVFERLLQTADQ